MLLLVKTSVSLKCNFAFVDSHVSTVTWVLCFLCTVNWFPGVVVINDHKSGGLKPQASILPHPGDQTSEVKVSQGRAPSRGSRGGSFPLLPAYGGSRRPWACPSHLYLCLPGASPLCLGLSSSVSCKDPVIGCRATLLQEDLISDPSLHLICKDPVS